MVSMFYEELFDEKPWSSSLANQLGFQIMQSSIICYFFEHVEIFIQEKLYATYHIDAIRIYVFLVGKPKLNIWLWFLCVCLVSPGWMWCSYWSEERQLYGTLHTWREVSVPKQFDTKISLAKRASRKGTFEY